MATSLYLCRHAPDVSSGHIVADSPGFENQAGIWRPWSVRHDKASDFFGHNEHGCGNMFNLQIGWFLMGSQLLASQWTGSVEKLSSNLDLSF
jgi:hypothetical protein